MFKFEGKKISIESDLTVGEGDDAITYPAASLQNEDVRDSIGIVYEADPVRPDDRLFLVTENPDGSYSTEPRPKDQTTAPVWGQIKDKRDSVKAGGILVEGKWFHTDDASRIQHMALTMMGVGIPANLQWKTMDGTFIIMSQALAGKIFQAAASMDMQALSAAETHRAALLAAANAFEYDFSAGWPQTYAEFVAAQE